MTSWTRIFIKPPRIPVDYRQLFQPLIDQTPAWGPGPSTRENVARFGTELIFVQSGGPQERMARMGYATKTFR
jgi:hypothetical protein